MKKHIGIIILFIVIFSKFIQILWFQDALSQAKNEKYHMDIEINDTTKQSGISFRHRPFDVKKRFKNVSPWLKAIGASVSIVDYNNDGYMDIFFPNTQINSQNHFYQNNKDGTFTEVSKKINLAFTNKDNPSTGALFFDCDNDFDQDLFLLSTCPKIYKYNKKKSVYEKSEIEDFTCQNISTAVNIFDYNHDGILDIIYAEYFAQDILKNKNHIPNTRGILPDNFYDSKNNAKIHIYEGIGQCRFKENKSIKIPTRGWHFAIGIFDFKDNGSEDIWLSSDFGADKLFIQSGDHYKDQSPLERHDSFSRNGMGADFINLDNDKNTFAYSAHIFIPDQKITGNLLWKFNSNKNTFTQFANQRNVKNCGWSWGTRFSDLNNDSLADLVVTNGFFGNKSKKSYWYNLSVLDASGRSFMTSPNNWQDMNNFSLAAGQRDCIFMNTPKGFKEITGDTQFDIQKLNGRGVAHLDILNNGSISMVVANQENRAKIYLNTQRNDHKWIGFNLVGGKNNTDVNGANIKIFLENGKVLSRQKRPANGFSAQSDPRIHFGLGFSPKIKKVILRWPDGKK